MACVQGAPARICTWELVTGFGQNPTEEDLKDYFHRDFPETEQLPKFWKMISFNSSEGRHHRYLVILGKDGDLPNSLVLFALADEQMSFGEGDGNFRYAAIVRGTLYVLVFYEGRLCHWSEERGYGDSSEDSWARERLYNMDEFLRRDPLFSQAEAFRYGNLEHLDIDFDNPAGEWAEQLRKASRDPFWKGLHLEPRRKGPRVALSIILLLTVMVAVLLAWENLYVGRGKLLGPEAPRLTPPATATISKEIKSRDFLKKTYSKSESAISECPKPALEIRGIVGNRLFSGLFSGMPVMKKIGDSLESYKVKSVLRDRVVLECGGREWEVLNGEAP